MESIISALIAGGLALIGVIITSATSNKRVEQRLITAQAVTDTKIENLTNEVKKHNDFGIKIPQLQLTIEHQQNEIDELKQAVKELKER